MNKFIRVMLISFVICLVIGGGILIAGIAVGGTLEDARVRIGGLGIVLNDDYDHGLITFYDDAEKDYADDSENSDDSDLKNDMDVYGTQVRKLELVLRNCELQILPADDGSISVEIEDSYKSYFTVKLDGDTLKIKDTRKKAANTLKTIEACIYIPQDQMFDEVDFDLGAGDIYIERLAANKIDIDGGAGSVDVRNLIALHSLDADLGAGEFYVGEAELGELDIDCGVGSFEIEGCLLNGDADVSGGIGDVSIGIIGEKTDFNYKLSCGMGNLEVFGDSYSSLGKDKRIDNNAPYTISLECGIGNISVYKAKK